MNVADQVRIETFALASSTSAFSQSSVILPDMDTDLTFPVDIIRRAIDDCEFDTRSYG